MRPRRKPSKQHNDDASQESQTSASLSTCANRKRSSASKSMRWKSTTCLLVLLIQLSQLICQTSQEEQRETTSNSQQAQQSISALQKSISQQLQLFNGNDSTRTELNHFKLMEREGEFLLLGARNVVYNLSLNSLHEFMRLEWPSSEEDTNMCRMKGKSGEQCQNYIRVMKLESPANLFVCGTNSYKPQCRRYRIKSDAYEYDQEMPGEGECPYQETQNITSVFADGHLYSATAAQFSAIDGLIHRSPLRTEQFNPKQLNSPNFVSSFRYGEHVYFLFRESAIEHINCGKTIYSRIARVCINDSGGQSRANGERWTSFVKARLNCSIPGEFPFYFDEIQASTQVVYGASHQSARQSHSSNPHSDLLYAVFTTPTNSIGGSAVCAYRMSDVLAAFDGPFKAQTDTNANWLPVPESRVPVPRPGTCVNDSKSLPDENVNFIKDNPLMDLAVAPIYSQPLVMMASINFRFTQITVDPQVETRRVPGSSQRRVDVIFVSTDDGRVFKLINTFHLHSLPRSSSSLSLQLQAEQQLSSSVLRESLPDVSSSTIIIEELHLFDSRTPIINMLLHQPSSLDEPAKLLVLSAKQLKAIPVSRCERALSCADCLALYDPYCAWDLAQSACLSTGRSWSQPSKPGWFPANSLANNHTLGWWLSCPEQQAGSQQVALPFKSLFSSHLQVPSRFDYASGHHLSHTSLVSLSSGEHRRQQHQPASECLTFCGGFQSNAVGSSSEQLMMSCADFVQQQLVSQPGKLLPFGCALAGHGNLYTSENLYIAVIICALSGLVLGLLFGFVMGRNSKKHDSSICSSTFDETNLYMASTGSHHNANLFGPQQQQHQRALHHPLLQHPNGNGLVANPPNAIRASNLAAHLFDSSQCMTQDSTPTYGNQQQQMLLHLAQGQLTGPVRTGNLPPIPVQQSPLVNTSSSSTLINQSQLTPNSLSSSHNQSSASSTNTSSTSATVPATDQLYLNQHQIQQQHQHHNQRSFTGSSKSSQLNNSSNKLMEANKLANINSAKNSSFLQQTQQQQQQQMLQNNNKFYL